MTSGPLSGNPEPTCFWVTPGGASLISQALLFLAPDGILIGQLQPHSGVIARDGRRIAFFLNLPLFLPREPETPAPRFSILLPHCAICVGPHLPPHPSDLRLFPW